MLEACEASLYHCPANASSKQYYVYCTSKVMECSVMHSSKSERQRVKVKYCSTLLQMMIIMKIHFLPVLHAIALTVE